MTTKRKQVVDALTSTMKINPSDYSSLTSPNRLKSFSYALAGWLYMLRHQKNTRIMAAASLVVMGLAMWLRVDFTGMAVLTLAITMVWMGEFVNAAVEAVVNLVTPDFHPMAKVAKDVASSAVLLGVVASIIVGLMVLGPPLLLRLSG